MKFKDMGLDENILEALEYMGFDEATPIQEQAIPAVLSDRDLIACAQTGTGKTAAFVLPVLHKLANKQDSHTNTLILVPTRELAIRIDQQIQGLSYYISVGSIAIYGGGNGIIYAEQERALRDGRDIIVATPGRLISHMAQGYVNFKHVKHLILDEADKMLDMGFVDDILKIVSILPKERETLMFSATMAPKIRSLARKILRNPMEINLGIAKPAEGVNQNVYLVYDNQKNAVLRHILDVNKDFSSIIVFTSAKVMVREIVQSLRQHGIKALGISSDLDQSQREEALMQFRAKRVRVLVATDIMSRGIDIKGIEMVINYDAPRDAEDYVHRIGRTARANSTGDAYTLINPRDMARMKSIEDLIEMQVPRLPLPEGLGEGPAWNPEQHGSKRPNGQRNSRRRGHGGNRRGGKRGDNQRRNQNKQQ
ncbi:MAG: DEAD/DEAH box helicase [Paludibacteraceae bacterium]|nr:DEAD/DEAH box helicase [Paludibacteraceae bacterium]